MFKLRIADILFSVRTDEIAIPKRFEPFRTWDSDPEDFQLMLSPCEQIGTPQGKILLEEGYQWIVSDIGEQGYIVCESKRKNGKTVAVLEIDPSWKSAEVCYFKSDEKNENILTSPLVEILYRNLILHYGGIIVHAAAIEWEGKGILFSAPSGTGKTTQANLWKQWMGAMILNGDRPVVRVLEHQPYIYGTPWSGSSQDYVNRSTPLSMIVVLQQSNENSIIRLTPGAAVQHFFPRCFLPFQDTELMQKAMNIFEMIINDTPVFLLRCKPEKQAVELVAQWLK